jgi:S-adenosylmethionine hydrolase
MNLITFTSDFGLQDNYVGVVKGVMLGINPAVTIVDLSHNIAPFSVEQAAFTINTAYRFFPQGTVHLAVIDPGVGSVRNPLIVQTAKYFFVGPDNGIFTHILDTEGTKCYVIRRESVRRQGKIDPEESTTFDGRDLFGPAAALLSAGVGIDRLADPMNDAPVLLSGPFTPKPGVQPVRVMHVDHFGNLVTMLHRDCLKGGMQLKQVILAGNVIGRISEGYQDVAEGELLAVWGSSGYLELSVNQGRAADLLGDEPEKAQIEVEIHE